MNQLRPSSVDSSPFQGKLSSWISEKTPGGTERYFTPDDLRAEDWSSTSGTA